MICPSCGVDKNRVTNTLQYNLKGECIKRRRTCTNCNVNFSTYECYEVADPEKAFKVADARDQLNCVKQWLKVPARHIPIVRDCVVKIDSALMMLTPESAEVEDIAFSSSE